MLDEKEEDAAVDELKRVDHLIYVTLKYTRTVDVLRNVVKRLISTIDFQINDFLAYAQKKKMIKEIPTVPLVKCKSLEKIYPKDSEIKNLIDFYYMLRKIISSTYRSREEYRKNVTLVTEVANVNIDVLKDYTERTKNFINYLKELMQ